MKNQKSNLTHSLLEFLGNSHTTYHAANSTINILNQHGFKLLKENDKWELQANGKYYIERNNTAVIAFKIGSKPLIQNGFKMAGSHIDSPNIKIKTTSPEVRGNITFYRTDHYGSAILSTWLDRPLGIAGRVYYTENNELKNKLFSSQQAIGTIANLAIHMNREVNNGHNYNKHEEIIFIVGNTFNNENPIAELVANTLNIKQESIVDLDLYLYDTQPPANIGINKELISSPKIDNLAATHAILTALTETNSEHTLIGMFYDHEEVGSQTRQGADSSFASNILERISISLNQSREEYFRTLSASLLLSVDGAHATHPAYMNKFDHTHSPVLNKGPALKINVNHRYATSGEGIATLTKICSEKNIPLQKLMNRADVPCGSTIGPISSSNLGVQTIDLGHPMLSMHSIRETCGTIDHELMVELIKAVFQH